jgi:tetratricopeptide (TPR) repeat protein
MDAEIDNARVAWDWAVKQRDIERLSQAMDGLFSYYNSRVRSREGEAACRSAVARLQPAAEPEAGALGDTLSLLVEILGYHVYLALDSGRIQAASDSLAQGLALVESSDTSSRDLQAAEAHLWQAGGWLGRISGRGEAQRAYERSLALYRAAGKRSKVAMVLGDLARMNWYAGDYEEASRNLKESAAIYRELDDPGGLSAATWLLGYARAVEGRLEDSERLARESLAFAQELGDPLMTSNRLTGVAWALMWKGRYADSLRLLEERVTIHRDIGFAEDYIGLHLVGRVELDLGHYGRAREHLREALGIARDKDALFGKGNAWLGLGRLALRDGILAEATRLLLDSIAAYETLGHRDLAEMVRCALACAALGLDDLKQARFNVSRALRWSAERGSFIVLVQVLPAAALLLLKQGEIERAVEIWELACTLPAVANSQWHRDVAGRPIAQAAKTSPPAAVAAAKERGRARDMQATLRELAAEFES